ncbi:hypothetical protein Taro_037938 [Colocasia esculenta]|uniref:Uncharacterized protein n=1 Tax=Colocasia esculenta TaxID=4460 RepID=A0A843W201_COLES|nr:hypothetical protein [Colocasia esculenta]
MLYPNYEVEEDDGHYNDEFFQLEYIDDFNHGHGGMLKLQDDIRLCNYTEKKEVKDLSLIINLHHRFRLQHSLRLHLHLCLQLQLCLQVPNLCLHLQHSLHLCLQLCLQTSHHFAIKREVTNARITWNIIAANRFTDYLNKHKAATKKASENFDDPLMWKGHGPPTIRRDYWDAMCDKWAMTLENSLAAMQIATTTRLVLQRIRSLRRNRFHRLRSAR